MKRVLIVSTTGMGDCLWGTPGIRALKKTFPNIDIDLVVNRPWKSLFDYADEGERINYDYSEDINYQGTFGQVEYANDVFSVFAQGAISNQSYKRYDRGNFAGEKTSETENKFGYNLKEHRRQMPRREKTTRIIREL